MKKKKYKLKAPSYVLLIIFVAITYGSFIGDIIYQLFN